MERAKKGVKEKKAKGAFIKGAITIAFGGFVAKIIGAVYRIPLTNLIGGRGIGLYQLVYPVYCLLLTVSATGIPSSIAKLTAEQVGKKQSTMPVLRTAMKLFLLIGLGAAIATAFGDLVESSIKRKVGLKDMGKIMPGHGGALDRIDGTLFATLVVYIAFKILFLL